MLIVPRFGFAFRARPTGFVSTHRVLATVLVGAALLAPGASRAQTSADSSVTLTWTAPGDDGNSGTATSYDLRYRTVGVAGTDTASWWGAATRVTGMPAPHAPGSSDSVQVRGLTPLTTYYFIIRTADEVPNWSGYSNLAVHMTTGSSDVTPPAAITDVTVTGSTGTTISIRWTAPGDDGTTGTASSYDVRYSTSAITSGNWGSASQASGEPVPAAAGTQQNFTVTGLAPGRTYSIAIRTTDNAGNVSGLSNVPSGNTLDTVAPAPVRDLSLDPDSGIPDPLVLGAEYEVASDGR